MPDADEQALLRKARLLDVESLGQIYDRFSPRLYAYAMRLMGDPQTAEDCVAETFTSFLQALQRGGGPNTHLQAYLYRIAHNWITDRYRRDPLYENGLPDDLADRSAPHAEEHTEIEQRRQLVRQALLQLTPEQSSVIVLKFIENRTNEEIAAAVGKPLGAVKSLQHRALESLRRWLMKADQNE